MQGPTKVTETNELREYFGIPRSHIPFYSDRDIYRAFMLGRRLPRWRIAWRVLRGVDYEARWNAESRKGRRDAGATE